MTNNGKPTPDEMGDQLDQEIKDTVHDWAENPEGTDYDDLDERVDEKLRRMVAGWAGAEEDADWKTIGSKTDVHVVFPDVVTDKGFQRGVIGKRKKLVIKRERIVVSQDIFRFPVFRIVPIPR